MAEQKPSKLRWVQHMREQKRLKRERTGDSPEKAAERHTPEPGVIDKWLKLSGVDRPSRFKR